MAKNASIALLLEDEPLISMDIELTLGGAGFDVETALSCHEANEWLDTHTPDVAIVDILLRDGPCHDVVSRLIAAKIPFLVHSGDHPSLYDGTPFAEGAWISKPAAANELVEAIQSLLAA